MVYLDTSILGSYYCPEALSAAVSPAIAPLRRPLISNLVELEFLSLVGLKVRTGDLNKANGRIVIDLFGDHVATGVYGRVEIDSPAFITAAA